MKTLCLFFVIAFAAVGQSNISGKFGSSIGSDPTGRTCTVTSPLLSWHSGIYYCNATVYALYAGGGISSAVWGGITGTLSSQTDLNTALGLKAPLASPTFTGTVTIPNGGVLGTPTSINLANATFPAPVYQTVNNSILTGPVDASGNPAHLTAGAGAVINVLGGTTPIVMYIAGVPVTISSNLTVTAATPAGETEYFVFVKQDGSTLVATNCPYIVAYTKPSACGTVAAGQPQYWFNLALNAMQASTDGSAYTPTPALFLGDAAVSSGPVVDAVGNQPWRLTPQRTLSDFGTASNGNLALTSGTTTEDGLFQYAGFMLAGASTLTHTASAGSVDTPGLLVMAQTPALFVGNSTMNGNAKSRGPVTGSAAVCTVGLAAGMGGGGGGSGGASATNAGCIGGGHWLIWSQQTSGAGTAGAIAGAGGAGAAYNQGWVGSGTSPFYSTQLTPFAFGGGATGASGAGVVAGGSGGNGGAGGGTVALKAPSLNLTSGSTIAANGANGTAGTTSTSSGGCGGGGGGGIAAFIGGFSVNGTTGITATAGTGATTCSGLSPASGNGAAGGIGQSLFVQMAW